MEKSLDSLFILNKSLICEREELRKKLFEKYHNLKISESTKMSESDFFKNVSYSIDDEEFEKTRKKHEKLRYLISSIDELQKEY